MIYGIGIDLVELDRMREIIEKRPAFVHRVLTASEIEIYEACGVKRKVEFLAGRFACKEAFSKAYGTGIGKEVSLQGIEILKDELGRPVITSSPFDGKIHVSITHTNQVAMAQIILEEN